MTNELRSKRQGPIAPFADAVAGLSIHDDRVKLGVKGSSLIGWAQRNGFSLPENLYDVSNAGDQGLIARVGSQEIILECPANDPLLTAMDEALAASDAGVYRIEQQVSTIELSGPNALRILAQTCAVTFATDPAGRIVYTRVAGVSCGIIVLEDQDGRTYRLWVDYTLTPYLWETLVEIARGL